MLGGSLARVTLAKMQKEAPKSDPVAFVTTSGVCAQPIESSALGVTASKRCWAVDPLEITPHGSVYSFTVRATFNDQKTHPTINFKLEKKYSKIYVVCVRQRGVV